MYDASSKILYAVKSLSMPEDYEREKSNINLDAFNSQIV